MAAIVPSVGEPKRKPTYDDVLAAPEHLNAEIIDGELILSQRPAYRHANASSVLGADVLRAFHRPGDRDRPGGWWILFEPELHFHEDVVIPDLAGWRRERMPRIPDVPGPISRLTGSAKPSRRPPRRSIGAGSSASTPAKGTTSVL